MRPPGFQTAAEQNAYNLGVEHGELRATPLVAALLDRLGGAVTLTSAEVVRAGRTVTMREDRATGALHYRVTPSRASSLGRSQPDQPAATT